MVFDRLRSRSERLLRPITYALSDTPPSTLSWMSFTFAVLTGLSIYFTGLRSLYLLPVALILLAISGLMDALDGAVARATGSASVKGDFLDHVLDRYSDIAIIAGFTFSSLTTHTDLGLFALAGVLMASYLGTQSQAVGLRRNYGGPLGRADRIVIMLLAIIIEIFLVLIHAPMASLLSLTTFDWLLLLFAVLGNITALYRAAAAWRMLHS